MVILLTGATGFIGERLASALSAAGHTVIAGRRDGRGSQTLAIDFTRDTDLTTWLPRLTGIDAVVNAVGVLRERGPQTFERIHTLAPQALFDACVVANVRRVVQVSALGADRGTTRYFSSKRAADEHLARLPLDWTIIQPALVFGQGGTSARLFTLLASLPVIPLPGTGRQFVQPIHIDDLVKAITATVSSAATYRQRVALVGPQPLTMRELLTKLRGVMRLAPTFFLPIPMPLMRIGARIAQLSSRSLLDRETLTMLEAGNTADPAATRQLLGRPLRTVEEFMDRREGDAGLTRARLSWLLPLLRISIAALWIWTAIVSFGLYPRESSYRLLEQVGVAGGLASTMLYAAATLDLVFGVLTLFMQRRRLLWLAQIATILLYTLIISYWLPEFWLHPYGPIIKNLPLLAAIYLLYVLEDQR